MNLVFYKYRLFGQRLTQTPAIMWSRLENSRFTVVHPRIQKLTPLPPTESPYVQQFMKRTLESLLNWIPARSASRTPVFQTLLLLGLIAASACKTRGQEFGLKWALDSANGTSQPTLDQNGVAYIVESDAVRMVNTDSGLLVGRVGGVFTASAVIEGPGKFFALSTFGEASNSNTYDPNVGEGSSSSYYPLPSIAYFSVDLENNSVLTNILVSNAQSSSGGFWGDGGSSSSRSQFTEQFGLSFEDTLIHLLGSDESRSGSSYRGGRGSSVSTIYLIGYATNWTVNQWTSEESWSEYSNYYKENGLRPVDPGFAVFNDGLITFSDPRISAHWDSMPVLWTNDFSGTCVAGDKGIILGSGSSLAAISAASGRVRWSLPQIPRGSVVVGAAGVLFHSKDSVIRAIDSGNGAILWERHLDFTVVGSPALGRDENLYFAGNSGFGGALVALSGKDGRQLWEYPLPVHVTSGPTIGADGTILFRTENAVVALYSNCGGLAKTPWPMEAQNPRFTRNQAHGEFQEYVPGGGITEERREFVVGQP